jgi:hypothetical protein
MLFATAVGPRAAPAAGGFHASSQPLVLDRHRSGGCRARGSRLVVRPQPTTARNRVALSAVAAHPRSSSTMAADPSRGDHQTDSAHQECKADLQGPSAFAVGRHGHRYDGEHDEEPPDHLDPRCLGALVTVGGGEVRVDGASRHDTDPPGVGREPSGWSQRLGSRPGGRFETCDPGLVPRSSSERLLLGASRSSRLSRRLGSIVVAMARLLTRLHGGVSGSPVSSTQGRCQTRSAPENEIRVVAPDYFRC